MKEYSTITAWMIVKRFMVGWGIGLGILTVYSCIKYREFIVTAFINNTWAWINAVIPVVIIIFAIGYLLRSLFR